MKEAVPVRLRTDGAIELTEADERTLALETTALAEGTIEVASLRSGRVVLRAEDEALLVVPVPAEITKAKGIEVGSEVSSGQLLATLRPVVAPADKIALGAQQADIAGQIAAQKAELQAKQVELDRGEKLNKEGLSSNEDLLARQTAVATAKARLEGLRSSAYAYEAGDTGTLLLKAPFAGTVAELSLPAGRTGQPGDPIARVVRPGSRFIDLEVPPIEPLGTSYALEGLDAALDAPSHGVVVAADGMRHDRLALPATLSGKLLPGARVWVAVKSPSPPGLVGPESAVVHTPAGALVFVRTAEHVYEPRSIRVLAQRGGRVVIEASEEGGLIAGSLAVSKGAAALRGEMLRAELRHQE